MARLLALRLDEPILAALREPRPGWDLTVETGTQDGLFRTLERGAGAAEAISGVAVGGVEDPVRTAQRIRMSEPEMPVVLVRRDDECPSLREALRFSPFGARNVVCVSSEPPHAAVEAIRGAVDRAAVRKRFRHTVSALNRQIAETAGDRAFRTAAGILGQLLDVAPIGVAVTDPAGHLQDVNPRAVQLLGRPEAWLLGRPVWEAFARVDRSRLKRLLAQLNGDPATQPSDLFQSGGGDEIHHLEVSGARLSASTGGPGYLVILQDVTDRVELVEQLQVSNRRKDEFLAMLGHELRNPLAPIRTATELMRLRGDTSSERERAIIERHVGHLVELVDDLLDVARITGGKLDLRRVQVDVPDFVGQAVEMVSPLLEERRHELRLSAPPEPLRVDGDPRRLAQVVSNLLTNAAKNTEPGGKISVTIRREGDDAVISVADDGHGIDPHLMPHIFELFVQERQSLDRAAGGLGLGLAIVQSLVAMHEGSVEATSELGKGSEFVVRLPALPAAAPRRSASASNPPAQDPSAETPRAVVLVVDDNEDAATLLAQLVAKLGFETHAAHDAPSALELAQRIRPDLALLDIGLPVVDGYELGQRLREIEGLEGIQLLAITGYGQKSDRDRSADAGFVDHLVKPVAIKTLREALDRAVPRSSETDPPP